jgi:hypothetical protein
MSIRVDISTVSMHAEAIMDAATRMQAATPDSQPEQAGFWGQDHTFL